MAFSATVAIPRAADDAPHTQPTNHALKRCRGSRTRLLLVLGGLAMVVVLTLVGGGLAVWHVAVGDVRRVPIAIDQQEGPSAASLNRDEIAAAAMASIDPQAAFHPDPAPTPRGSIVVPQPSVLDGPAGVPTGFPDTYEGAVGQWAAIAQTVQHSGMVRREFRDRTSGIIPRRYGRAVYSIASGLLLTAIVTLWQPSDTHLFVLDGPFRLAAYAGVLAAIAVFVWGAIAQRRLDLFGLAAIQAHLRGTTEAASELVIRGPYRWVRHPWYAAAIVLFWSCPDMTADRLLFNVLWTVWICMGATFEEKDLLTEFGDDYARYRQRVPMLIPWRGVSG